MASLGIFELLLILPLLGVIIWGIADAATRPEHAFQAAGQNKVLWIVLQALGLLACFLGAVLSIVYLTTIRPKVRAAEAGGPAGPGGPSGPPQPGFG